MVDFYYQLKTIDSTGFISKETLLTDTEWMQIDPSSIYRNINDLIRKGWMRRVSNGYRLCTYKTFFKDLRVEFNHWDQETLIEGMRPSDLSAFHEIRRNLAEQVRAANRAIQSDETYQRSYTMLRENDKYSKMESLVHLNTAYMVEKNQKNEEIVQYHEQGAIEKAPQSCNPLITLSNKGAQKLLEASSTSVTHHLMIRLETYGYLVIERENRVRISDKMSYLQFMKEYGFGTHTYLNGYAWKVLPNYLQVPQSYRDMRRKKKNREKAVKPSSPSLIHRYNNLIFS